MYITVLTKHSEQADNNNLMSSIHQGLLLVVQMCEMNINLVSIHYSAFKSPMVELAIETKSMLGLKKETLHC